MNVKTSAFRLFCTEKWFEHKDELFEWTHQLPDYDEKYYFRKHRWMLKKMYQEANKINNIGEQ